MATDKKKITPILLDEETRKKLDIICAEEDMYFSEWVSEMINMHWMHNEYSNKFDLTKKKR